MRLSGYLLALLTFVSTYQAFSQASSKECQRMIKQAIVYADSGKYAEAIRKLAAAKICDEALATKADRLIITIYDKVNQERIKAEQERNRAQFAERSAKEAKQAETAQKNLAMKALKDARVNLSKAMGIQASRSLINKNKLETIALLSNLTNTGLPVSNEAYASLLQLTPSQFRFTKKGNIPLPLTLRRHPKPINWLLPTHDPNLLAISDGEFNLGLYNQAHNTFKAYPETQAWSISRLAILDSVSIWAAGGTGLFLLRASGQLQPMASQLAAKQIYAGKSSGRIVIGTESGQLLLGKLNFANITITDTLLQRGLNEFDVSQSERRIVGTDYGLTLYCWDTDTKRQFSTSSLQDTLKRLKLTARYNHPSVKLSSDGNLAATIVPANDSVGRAHDVLILYQLTERKARLFVFDEGGLESNHYQFNSKGDKVIVATANAVYVFDAIHAQLLWKVTTQRQLFAVDPRNQFIVIADNNEIGLYNLNTGEFQERATVSKRDISAMHFTTTGHELIVADVEGILYTLSLSQSLESSYIINGKPFNINKRYFFNQAGSQLLVCRPWLDFDKGTTWSSDLYDTQRKQFIGRMHDLPELPFEVFFKDTTQLTYVFRDRIVAISTQKEKPIVNWEFDEPIILAALNEKKNTLVYVSGNKLYERNMRDGHIERSIPLNNILHVNSLLVHPTLDRLVVIGSTKEGYSQLIEYVDRKHFVKKLMTEPVFVTYSSTGTLIIVSHTQIDRLEYGKATALPLDIPLPLETTGQVNHNFLGQDCVMLVTRTSNERRLNLMYIDLNSGYNTIISNSLLERYDPQDTMLSAIHLDSKRRMLRTVSYFGFLQEWGGGLYPSTSTCERETNLKVIGSTVVPIN